MTVENEKALQEFLSEAQEIVDAFNRNLLRLDEALRAHAPYDPDTLNDAFRAVHSLKGLSGLFGVARLTHLAHNLENLLDSLRLGRVALEPATLDLLFEAVGLFQKVIGDSAGAASDNAEQAAQLLIDDFVARLERVGQKRDADADEAPWGGWELDAGLLAVLTEYEEHRLRENIRAGNTLYRIHCAFDLMTIDKELEQLKARLKPIGEVLTYLPSTDTANDQQIELDVILGSSRALAEVRAAVESESTVVVMIPRRTRGEAAAASAAAGAGVGAAAAPSAPAAAPVDKAAVPSNSGAGSGSSAGGGDAGGSGGGGGGGGVDEEGGGELSLRSLAQTVRVDIRKLDSLMNIVGELAIARAGLQQLHDRMKVDRALQHLARPLHEELRAFSRRLDELQAGILEVRMVPLGQVFDKLSRVVRKMSRDAKKEVRLHVTGADTELDKLIVEELSDPLVHVIRNCIDHGIEPADVRRARGKAEVGTIAISAEQRGNHVILTIEDDGAGIDAERVIAKAVARGLVDGKGARELSQREALNLIFLPGVSTKEVADHVSGRGVGMDVVKTNIARLSGIIDVESELGVGTRLTITLPITLAIIQALVVRAAGRTYAIPLNSVLESLIATANDVSTIERREVMTLRGQTLPLARLERLFRLKRGKGATEAAAAMVDGGRRHRQFVVVVGLAQHRVGLMVDELVGQQDIVVKPLGRALTGIPGIAGATELGGKRTVLVLDVAALVEEVIAGPGARGGPEEAAA
jgi:two-component system chemotaxis sensor kinase CheA